MKRFHLKDGGPYALTVYGDDKADALRRYRLQWYPDRSRLPAGIEIWES